MKKMTKLQKIILLSLTGVFLFGIVGVYFLQIKPLYDELAKVERSISTEKKQLAAIQKRHDTELGMDISGEAIALQNQLPLHPYYEQLFYLLNDAQSVSGSTISNYNIAEAEPVSFEEVNVEGLRGITFVLDVVSPSYNSMMDFIDFLEKGDRILSVEQVSFSESETDDVQFTLTFLTYYQEGLDGLREHQPSINIPNPANKTNPLQ
ncbi:hypothetical protein [Salirhabdus sp. Marseille-P4669]|uniref:hypothetical protein n=1 Tax=Salirhabdus sp. Marseille-P4669 TaxID=2042310 RepID=UPI000C7CB95C|nr:hypothetical protein [Salirhabdus sp. Marseille-P4669]